MCSAEAIMVMLHPAEQAKFFHMTSPILLELKCTYASAFKALSKSINYSSYTVICIHWHKKRSIRFLPNLKSKVSRTISTCIVFLEIDAHIREFHFSAAT